MWKLRFSIRDNTGEFGIGAKLAVHLGFAPHSLNTRPRPKRSNFQHQRVAGDNRTAKARFLNAREEHQFLSSIFDFAQCQDRAALGQRFDHQHAGHDWCAWEMALKVFFVNADLFNSNHALAGHQFNDSIDQQERITVRKEFFYPFRVENCFHWLGNKPRLQEFVKKVNGR